MGGHRRGGGVREGHEDDDGGEEVARRLGDQVGGGGGLAGQRQALDRGLYRAVAAYGRGRRAHARVVSRGRFRVRVTVGVRVCLV